MCGSLLLLMAIVFLTIPYFLMLDELFNPSDNQRKYEATNKQANADEKALSKPDILDEEDGCGDC